MKSISLKNNINNFIKTEKQEEKKNIKDNLG
jgi:hypothetical protein